MGSEHSGMLCFDQAFAYGLQDLKQAGAVVEDPRVEHWRACDIEPDVQKLLCLWDDQKTKPPHVFQDMEGRLPARIRAA
eukprot:11630104-Alexandrium_andersonii.AAC.1